MPDHDLTTFLAIHRAGGISAASAQLHLSQSAVSRRLQMLEEQLGAPLFERTRAGLRLTSAGEVLLPHAERVRAAELDAVRAIADHLGKPMGAVRIGIVGSLAGAWFTGVLEAVRKAHPEVDLVVSTATSREIRDQVLRGDITLGVSYLRPDDADLDVCVLFDERLVVVCHAGHRLAGRRARGFERLRGERWLLFPEHRGHPESASSLARAVLRRNQVPDDLIRPIDSLTAQRALVQAGYGLGFVPCSTVVDDLADGSLCTIDVGGEPIVTPIALISRAAAYLSPAARAVARSLARGAP